VTSEGHIYQLIVVCITLPLKSSKVYLFSYSHFVSSTIYHLSNLAPSSAGHLFHASMSGLEYRTLTQRAQGKSTFKLLRVVEVGGSADSCWHLTAAPPSFRLYINPTGIQYFTMIAIRMCFVVFFMRPLVSLLVVLGCGSHLCYPSESVPGVRYDSSVQSHLPLL
jgi:hypothetical protein